MSRVAIIGAAETALGKRPDVSRLALHAEAARLALADAGIRMRDVDGIFSSVADPNELSEYFGIVPRYIDGTSVGGCSTIIQLRHAAAAIAAGYCSVALIVHGESGRSWIDMERPGTAASPVGQFETPYGAAGAATLFALGALAIALAPVAAAYEMVIVGRAVVGCALGQLTIISRTSFHTTYYIN